MATKRIQVAAAHAYEPNAKQNLIARVVRVGHLGHDCITGLPQYESFHVSSTMYCVHPKGQRLAWKRGEGRTVGGSQ